MHCSMSTADSTATPRAKACNYDSASTRYTLHWEVVCSTGYREAQKPARIVSVCIYYCSGSAGYSWHGIIATISVHLGYIKSLAQI